MASGSSTLPIILLGLFLGVPARAGAPEETIPDGGKALEKAVAGLRWFGQASVRIELSGVVVHVDPRTRGRASDHEADLILVTHEHWDHYDWEEVVRLAKASSVVIAPFGIRAQLPGRVVRLRSGQSLTEGDVTVEAIPAYHDSRHHPRSAGGVGYLLTIGGVRIYVAGDTGRTPEMKGLSCDLAVLPLGPTYTMSGPKEAAQAALDVKARVAVPYHWGMNEGTRSDALAFARLLEGKVKVVILDPD